MACDKDGVWKMMCDKVVCDKVVWKMMCERWCVTKWCDKDGVWKVVCQWWWVIKWCVKDGVWQSCLWKMVCKRWCVKDGVEDGVWQRWCVKDGVWKMVSDKAVCQRWCVTKLCMKDGVCVWTIWTDVKPLPAFFDFQIYSLEVFASCPKTAGGAGGADETGTNKDTHQLPVIPMGTLMEVLAFFTAMATG